MRSDGWRDRFNQFKQRVQKPWDEWTEEEIISDPKWILIYYKSNGIVSTSMHASMILSNSIYLKNYIELWQKQKQSVPQ